MLFPQTEQNIRVSSVLPPPLPPLFFYRNFCGVTYLAYCVAGLWGIACCG